jgi:hypothetical protein
MKFIILFVFIALSIEAQDLPDLQPMKVLDLKLSNSGDLLRFSTGIVNSGRGPFEVESKKNEEDNTSEAIQRIYEGNRIVQRKNVGNFIYHPTHKHWHLEAVAQYSVHNALDNGMGGKYSKNVLNSVTSEKVSFCLIDSFNLNPDVKNEIKYQKCEQNIQGISAGYVDMYNYYLPGQNLRLKGLENGQIFYMVVNVNPKRIYQELNIENNVAWVSFSISGEGGSKKLNVIGYSDCSGTKGLCGQYNKENGDPTGQGYGPDDEETGDSEGSEDERDTNDDNSSEGSDEEECTDESCPQQPTEGSTSDESDFEDQTDESSEPTQHGE